MDHLINSSVFFMLALLVEYSGDLKNEDLNNKNIWIADLKMSSIQIIRYSDAQFLLLTIQITD